MTAPRFGKLIAGTLKNLTMRERLAAQWCATHDYEMPDEKWASQSENHAEAVSLCAEIFHARNTQGRAVRLTNYITLGEPQIPPGFTSKRSDVKHLCPCGGCSDYRCRLYSPDPDSPDVDQWKDCVRLQRKIEKEKATFNFAARDLSAPRRSKDATQSTLTRRLSAHTAKRRLTRCRRDGRRNLRHGDV